MLISSIKWVVRKIEGGGILKKNRICCFILLVCLLTVNAHASTVKEGPYVGLGIAGSFDHFDLKTENKGTSFEIQKSKNNSQVLGSAFLGYGFTTCNLFYIGAELGTYFPERSANLTRPGVTLTAFSFTNRFSVQDYLTGDFLLGYRPYCCWLLYVRGGASFSRIRLHQFENLAAQVPTLEVRKNKAGGRVGVGINYAFNKNWGLGLDYIYTTYQNFRFFWDQFDQSFNLRTDSHYLGLSTIYSF